MNFIKYLITSVETFIKSHAKTNIFAQNHWSSAWLTKLTNFVPEKDILTHKTPHGTLQRCNHTLLTCDDSAKPFQHLNSLITMSHSKNLQNSSLPISTTNFNNRKKTPLSDCYFFLMICVYKIKKQIQAVFARPLKRAYL